MKPRKILYITRVAKGGMAVVVDQLARGLDRKRYEPIVLFDTCSQSTIREKLSKSDIKTIDLRKCSQEQASTLPNSRKNRDIGGKVETHFGKRALQVYLSLKTFAEFILQQAPRIWLLVRTIRKNEIDLVHTHTGSHNGRQEIIAAWLTGVPCIAHYHFYTKLMWFDKVFARLVDSFVYVSRHQAEYYIAQGIPRAKSTIIHNGVDMNEFTRPYAVTQVYNEFDIKPNETLVGLIGRIDWWKGHEYFLKAMAEAAKRIPDLKGLIIGGNVEKSTSRNRKYFSKLQSMVKALGLDNKIIFTGFRNDVPRLVAALDVVVHASSTPEPFGLVVIEGMAAGKPVVATAAGGVLDIIKDGMNGLLVPCKDSEAMSQAIVQIVSNRYKAVQMGLAARHSVAEKFTVQQQVTAVQKLYDCIFDIPRDR